MHFALQYIIFLKNLFHACVCFMVEQSIPKRIPAKSNKTVKKVNLQHADLLKSCSVQCKPVNKYLIRNTVQVLN